MCSPQRKYLRELTCSGGWTMGEVLEKGFHVQTDHFSGFCFVLEVSRHKSCFYPPPPPFSPWKQGSLVCVVGDSGWLVLVFISDAASGLNLGWLWEPGGRCAKSKSNLPAWKCTVSSRCLMIICLPLFLLGGVGVNELLFNWRTITWPTRIQERLKKWPSGLNNMILFFGGDFLAAHVFWKLLE